VDGGRGQLHSARDALAALGLHELPLISLAKREEEIFVPGRAESLRLPRRSPALRLLQQARDEAHRFAITYNRKRRSLRTLTSELLRVPGIGPTRRRALLRAFGSVEGVRSATAEQIGALPGFSMARAEQLLAALRPADAIEPASDTTRTFDDEPSNDTADNSITPS
ncbi:MAG TPA: helix-hairpin-helix domain-containing protein, partial [Gemmatimonadaceae bacterium]|nr:helix-hairpin-helix domain-containing protein [Gemmatimonadaceae bacterium]